MTNIVMNTKQRKLPSPSLSAASTTRTTPSPQAPTSTKDSLPSYGISIEDADQWNEKYNRTSLPLMPDHLFWNLLVEIASDTPEVEPKLKSVMEQKTTDSRNEFNDQASDTMLSGTALFKDSSRLMEFFSALNQEHTILGLEAFMSRCLPLLIDGHLKRKSKRGPKQRKPAPAKVSGSSSKPTGKPSIRRSDRSKAPVEPSTRQDGRRRSSRICKQPNASSG
jgi:hypothetical protein